MVSRLGIDLLHDKCIDEKSVMTDRRSISYVRLYRIPNMGFGGHAVACG